MSMLPGWTRQVVRTDDVVLYILYSDGESDDARLPGRTIVATARSVMLFVDDMVLHSEVDVRGFVDMIVDAWYDTRDLFLGLAPREGSDLDASDALTLHTDKEERLSDSTDGAPFEYPDAGKARAKVDAIVAKADGVVASCDGVVLRSSREVRVLARRLVATWGVVGYLRTGGESPMRA